LSPSNYYAFVSTKSAISIPKTVKEAVSHPRWRQAMIDEMTALESTGTWKLVPHPPEKSTVGCRWVLHIKVYPDGQVDRLKARVVIEGYTQNMVLSIVKHWSLHQLDIKIAFLHET
jgi:hypothetical protein